MASGRMFDEVGVLPDTFVLQPAAERPSWTQAFADRWLWEKARAKDRVIKAYQFIAIKFFMVRLTPPEAHAALPLWSRIKSYFPPRSGWYNFQLLQSAMIADALYKDMYTALAAGNLDRVEGKLKRDVLASLRSRVLSRGSHTDTRWKLEKYNAKPRTVAYTVALVDPNKPKWRQTWMQQAVVEMDTEQSLVRTKRVIRPGGREEVVEGKKESGGTVREYVVIQKLVVDGVEEGWKIWGMTRATTLADVKKAERKRLGLEEEEGEEV
ncbi:hypothetical protein K461DRAFT_280393 [Myriangium duriaei CBS 260.36]|uniref:Tim44-like domain-containing protein n=1 Tax=Myriangium duriaei CBS 260.36 TaxID=1168546 RepID=A0A9P4MEP8_9PEZI|nr:hypothetical protein K461DRAFT_280393 [Myriangium duriaei CBS 260.36]